MLFALICRDKVGGLDLRLQTRPDHVAYLSGLGDALKAAGPLTDDAGSPIGSLVIIEATDRAGALAIAEADPYAKAGLFDDVEIVAWNWVIKNPENEA